jgi:hypothetical protein
MAKLEAEYRKHLRNGRPEVPERIRFVTYTPKNDVRSWVGALAQQKQYEKSVIDAKFVDGMATISTTNVRHLGLTTANLNGLKLLTVDGVAFTADQLDKHRDVLELVDGKWVKFDRKTITTRLFKRELQQGPIDDAFMQEFSVFAPTGKPWHAATATFLDARRDEFARNWNKHFRGELPDGKSLGQPQNMHSGQSFVLFGDPQSNPETAKVLPKLPITWTKDELVVNGVKYDPATHVPVLIYPKPDTFHSYIVINSGHTFREADLKGTNALLYPRLGDWAVLKPKPTKDDPAGFEVVAAGLFDENWQFEKK